MTARPYALICTRRLTEIQAEAGHADGQEAATTKTGSGVRHDYILRVF